MNIPSSFPTMARETSIDPAKLDKTRRRVWDLLQDRGMDMKAASFAACKAPTYMRDYLVKGRPEEMPESVREALAKNLQVDADFSAKNGLSRNWRMEPEAPLSAALRA